MRLPPVAPSIIPVRVVSSRFVDSGVTTWRPVEKSAGTDISLPRRASAIALLSSDYSTRLPHSHPHHRNLPPPYRLRLSLPFSLSNLPPSTPSPRLLVFFF